MPPFDLTIMGILTENHFRSKLTAVAKVAKFAQKRHFRPCEFVRNSSRQNSPPKKRNVKKVLHPTVRGKLYFCSKAPAVTVGSVSVDPFLAGTKKTPPFVTASGGVSISAQNRPHPPRSTAYPSPKERKGTSPERTQCAPFRVPSPLVGKALVTASAVGYKRTA